MKKIIVYILITCFLLAGCSALNVVPEFSQKPIETIEPFKPMYKDLENTECYLDLSSWIDDVDFETIKENGVTGVILRLARYNLDKDESFDTFYNGAKSAGLKIGCYYFMNAADVDTAHADAAKVINLLSDYEIDLPVFYDVENEHDHSGINLKTIGKKTLAGIISAFCDDLRDAGFDAGFYCNMDFAMHYINMTKLRDYPFWAARWTPEELSRSTYPNLALHQYVGEAELPGIEGTCGLNRCYLDLTERIR